MGNFAFAAGSESVVSFVHGEWLRSAVAFALFLAIAGFAVMLAFSERLRQWAADISPNWIVGACATLILVIALSPYVAEKRWPFSAWFPPAPSADEIADAVSQRIRPSIATSAATDAGQWSLPNGSALSTVDDKYSYANKLSLEETVNTIKLLAHYIDVYSHVTFVITAPKSNKLFERDLYALIVGACNISESKSCTIEPAPDTDKVVDTGIPDPTHEGIVVHHKTNQPVGMTSFQAALHCFDVKDSAKVPDSIERLDPNNSGKLYWFEIGNGSPWNPGGCS